MLWSVLVSHRIISIPMKNSALLTRWLESLSMIHEGGANLLSEFENGILADSLLSHFTRQRATLLTTQLSRPDVKRQNWIRVLQAHKMQLVVPPEINEAFIIKFLDRTFDEHVYQPIRRQQAPLLSFVEFTLALGGLQISAASLAGLRPDIVQKPFIPLLAQAIVGNHKNVL